MKKFLIFLVLIVVAVAIAGYFIASYTKSEGSRVGHLVKISEKGLMFKTYEGELNLGGLNTSNNTVGNYLWTFSVPHGNRLVYDSLDAYQGKEVKLYYKQRVYSYPWQGDTDYYVDKVSLVNGK
jgi:hypothetical protein